MVNDPETANLQGQLVAQLLLGGLFMVLTFDEIARGLLTFGVPKTEAEGFALLFDIAVGGSLSLVYLMIGRRDGCLSLLISWTATVGIWGTYFTVAMRGGLQVSP